MMNPDIIASAIQSARYNEAVVVTTVNNNDDEASSEIVLVACLDQENGGIIWKNATAATVDAADGTSVNASCPQDIGIVRHLRTKRWVLPMLNDRRRNYLYDIAIRKACRTMVKRRIGEKKETIRILDIGSGTGLLAMMAATQCLQSINALKEDPSFSENNNKQELNVQVTGVEMASAMARLARMTIEENNLSDYIKVVEQHSTDAIFRIDDSRFVEEEGSNSTSASGTNINNYATNEKADICTSELLESGLLGEGFIPSIRDAYQRHLKSDAIVIPKRARVYAVLVEGMPINGGTNNSIAAFLGPELDTFHKASGGVWMSTSPQSTSLDETGGDNHELSNNGRLLGSQYCDSSREGECSGGITIPLHADAMLDKNYRDKSANLIMNEEQRLSDDFRCIRPLSDKAMVLEFDFSSLETLPPQTGRSVATTVIPTADGVCHGVLFWWELDLWDGDRDDSTYSTEPIGIACSKTSGASKSDKSSSNWQDHWQQCLFVFGGGYSHITKGSPVEIIASHDDNSISFFVNQINASPTEKESETGNKSKNDSDSRPSQRRRLNDHNDEGNGPVSKAKFNKHISPARALQLNDSSRIQTLTAAIRHCIDTKGQDSPVLDLSDFGICAMIASEAGARKITSLESSSSGTLPTIAATVAQVGNGLPKTGTEFQIIQALAEHITEEHIGGKAEIVVAEPYFEMLEGWHLQEAMNYFYLVRSMKKRSIISSTAVSVPAFANVMACVVEFDDFFSAYGHVGDDNSNGGSLVAGFGHNCVNHYGDCHTYDVSLPLWQYRYRRLSTTCCIASISYEGTDPTIGSTFDSPQLICTGLAQAVVIWVDYACRTGTSNDGSGDIFQFISTASSSHRQLVRKLLTPIAITEADVRNKSEFICKASYGTDPDGIEDHSFTFEFNRKEDL